jgi:hypothetical protein
MDEVANMPPQTRSTLGIPTIIPQVDYTPTKRFLDSVIPDYFNLRKAFGLDQEIGQEPMFNTEGGADGGKISEFYNRQTMGANNRAALYTLVSEMSSHPLISAALDIYASEATVPDPISGKVCWVESPDPAVRQSLQDLLTKLGLDGERAYGICHSLSEYGDCFEHIVPGDQSVAALKYVHPSRLTRIEDQYGRLQGFAAGILNKDDAKWEENLEKKPEMISYPWDFVHFRIQSSNRESVHGDPLTLPARRSYQQLKMIEDMLVLYRLSRGMDRDVYYVNTRGATPSQQWRNVHEFRQQVRKKLGINPMGGSMRQEFDPKTPDKDLFIPTSGSDDPTRVERQKGGGPQGDIPDVDHFRRVLLGSLRIPAGFIGFESDTPSRATLASQSSRFARACRRLQKAYIQGVRWICESHLIRQGMTTRDDQGRFLIPFKIKMSPINQVEELTKMEILEKRISITQNIFSMAQIQGVPNEETGETVPTSPIVRDPSQFIAWNLRHNMGMGDAEIEMFMGDRTMGMTPEDVIVSQLMESKDFDPTPAKEEKKEDLNESKDYVDDCFVESKERSNDFELLEQETALRAELHIEEGRPIIRCPSCKTHGMDIKKDEINESVYLLCGNCGNTETV